MILQLYIAIPTYIQLLLSLIQNWTKYQIGLNLNKLSLNIDKTNYMLFHSPHRTIDINVCIKLNNRAIVCVDQTKFLGVIIDKHINWKPHISKVIGTISKTVGIISKLKWYVPGYILQCIYNTIILPHLYYCTVVWGCACPTFINKLHILQKRVARCIYNVSYCYHSSPLLKSLNMLNIFDIHKYQVGIFMYKCTNNCKISSSFKNYFTAASGVHAYNTRNQSNIYRHHSYSAIVNKSFRYYGPKLWNSFPETLRNSVSLDSFKRKLKLHLIKKY